VVSYIGLGVSTYSSGERERHGHITKRGSAELRAMLCEAAHHVANVRHPLNPYFTRICARHGFKKAVVCVAQRLARILYQMWRNEEDLDLNKLNVEPTRTIRTRRLYYRIKAPSAACAAG
jgi:transposase